jgi:GxxExxY protein
VELESVERLELVHQLQLLTYLRLSGRWMGLLLNFNTNRIENGLRRMLNG